MDGASSENKPILPSEVTIEIFLRLRVQALLRFRSVCKEWCNVIDSTYFLNLHLSRSIQNEMDRNLIIMDKYRKSGKSGIFSVDLKSLEEAVELDFSWWPEDRYYEYCGITFICSCNGLLCLCCVSTDIALWNPSTKKHLLLPPLIFDDELQLFIEHDSSFSTVLGFGFDFASDDYKVVSINEQYTCDARLVDTEAKVFSLKSNSWQRLYGFPKGHTYKGHGTFVKGSLHWLITPSLSGTFGLEVSSYHYSIVALDLTTEGIQIVATPSSVSEHYYVHIGIIEGCLSVSCFERDLLFDLWIQKEYGLEDSWTKLISIHDPNFISCYLCYPIFYSRKNSEILLTVEPNSGPTEVSRHNFGSKCTRKVSIRGSPECFCGYKLIMESLVRLDGIGH